MYCTECGAKAEDGSQFCTSCGAELKSLKKGRSLKKILPVLVLAAVVVVAAAALIMPGRFSDKNPVVYLSGNQYKVIQSPDGENTKSIEFAKSDISSEDVDFNNDSWVQFSADGKYMFYLTKNEGSGQTGTLNRVEYSKLKDQSSKNEEYVTIIDNDVYSNYQIVDGDKVVYRTEGGNLFYFDGEESQRIKRGVTGFYTCDGNIYYTVEQNDIKEYYVTNVENISQEQKLFDKYDLLFPMLKEGSDEIDLENILYAVNNNNSSIYTLYRTGVGIETEKVADNITQFFIDSYEGSYFVYFTSPTGEKLNLYDYVIDEYAEDDNFVVKPDKDDFSVPNYLYLPVPNTCTESTFSELYTSVTKDLKWYHTGWLNYSMNESLDMEWGENAEAIKDATRQFISGYGSAENADGYILVTEEVKKELKKINAADPSRSEDEWIKLCCYREQFGNRTDYDAYNAACDIYNEAADRMRLRQELKDNANACPVQNLYCYKDGAVTTVAENVCGTYETDYGFMGDTPILFYTKDQLDLSVNIDEIGSVCDMSGKLNQVETMSDFYVLLKKSAEVCTFAEGSAEELKQQIEDTGYVEYTCTDSMLFAATGDGRIVGASITDHVIGDWNLIAEDISEFGVTGNTFYYTVDTFLNENIFYCNLYKYENGESICVANDVLRHPFQLYSDNRILAYSDFSTKNCSYEISIFDEKGEKTVISDDVSDHKRIDPATILFISNGDLYEFKDGEKSKIGSDVQYFWTPDEMKYERMILNQ